MSYDPIPEAATDTPAPTWTDKLAAAESAIETLAEELPVLYKALTAVIAAFKFVL